MINFLLWPPMIVVKTLLALLGLVIVPIGLATGHMPELYAATSGRPWTFWEMAIRNPVDGLKRIIRHPKDFKTVGEVLEAIHTNKRFQWRYRWSGPFSSIRLLWQYSGRRYGEFYLGWKLGSEPPDLDFAVSLRPYARTGE